MNPETKTCAKCQTDFTIEPEDFVFYEKIGVPAPTWCPTCRVKRRMIWRNNSNLFKIPDYTGEKEIFAMFSPDTPVQVMDRDEYWSDDYNASGYGREYDWDRPFFDQYADLLAEVPRCSRSVLNIVDSDYCANCSDMKSCYLVFGAFGGERCYYSYQIQQCTECVDVEFTTGTEQSYFTFYNTNCFKTHYSKHCDGCQDVWFSSNCSNCSDCFGCINLRNKQYCIFNQQYSKEDYFTKLAEFDLGSYSTTQHLLEQIKEFWLQHPYKFMSGTKNQDVSGEYLDNCKNVHQSYYIKGCEDMKYCQFVYGNVPSTDNYDILLFGANISQSYESVIVGHDANRVLFSVNCYKNCARLQYCVSCHITSDCFGCVGLRNNQFCILNQQYTESEYHDLLPRIKEHMNTMPYVDQQGIEYRYGEFFPSKLSPLEYNVAYTEEFFPLGRDEAMEQGYRWYDEPEPAPATMLASEIPDHIDDVDESILSETIACSMTGKPFRLHPEEFAFYKRHSLPIPRRSPKARHQWRQQNWQQPFGFYSRTTDDGQQVITSYAPDRPERILSERGYQQEIL